MQADYFLSKRTDVYAQMVYQRGTKGAGLGASIYNGDINAFPSSKVSQTAATVGLRHSFQASQVSSCIGGTNGLDSRFDGSHEQHLRTSTPMIRVSVRVRHRQGPCRSLVELPSCRKFPRVVK
ncbi:conserved hypothetical protein [Burkholderia lata]|uniref:Porin n=1 Tax=Burkholderia lata (strain ATCC 17760 / DSM 23089 / LMG 22485 / NCIMB 9086 / R18194 / 383) TaxID=482957 RepID=Q39NW9_BURL3|nr:conserved hypothetical protein [Burkholderia lata]